MNKLEKLQEATVLALQGKLVENVNNDSDYYCNKFNELVNQFNTQMSLDHHLDAMDTRREVMSLLENAPDGIVMYRARADKKDALDEYKKENGIWTMCGIRKDNISDASIAILYNSGKLMTKEDVNKDDQKNTINTFLSESIGDRYYELLNKIRKYYPNFIPSKNMGEHGLEVMLKNCRNSKGKPKVIKLNNKTNSIKPDPVSKEYSDNPDVYEDIDNKPHVSFDIQEKQNREGIK